MLQEAAATLPNGLKELPITCEKSGCQSERLRYAKFCANHMGLPSLLKIDTVIKIAQENPGTANEIHERMRRKHPTTALCTTRSCLNYGVQAGRLTRTPIENTNPPSYIYSMAVAPPLNEEDPAQIRRRHILEAVRNGNGTAKLAMEFVRKKFKLRVARSTARYDLERLVKEGVLASSRQGIEVIYREVLVKEEPSKKNGHTASAEDVSHVLIAFFRGLEEKVQKVEDRLTGLEEQLQKAGDPNPEIQDLRQQVSSIKNAFKSL